MSEDFVFDRFAVGNGSDRLLDQRVKVSLDVWVTDEMRMTAQYRRFQPGDRRRLETARLRCSDGGALGGSTTNGVENFPNGGGVV